MIEVSGLAVRRGCRTLFERIGFRVTGGKTYGIYSRDADLLRGLLQVLSGAVSPSAGTVKINGFDPEKEPEKAKRCVGYLPGAQDFCRDMTVFAFLDLVAGLRGVYDERRFRQINGAAELTGIGDLRGRILSTLTLPEIRRVWLAQLLIGSPDVLLLDDPLSGLGADGRERVAETVRTVADGKTVFYASTDADTLGQICDAVMELSPDAMSEPTDAGVWLAGRADARTGEEGIL